MSLKGRRPTGRDPARDPLNHKIKVVEASASDLRAEAWSYLSKGKREVYVYLKQSNVHVATMKMEIRAG